MERTAVTGFYCLVQSAAEEQVAFGRALARTYEGPEGSEEVPDRSGQEALAD